MTTYAKRGLVIGVLFASVAVVSIVVYLVLGFHVLVMAWMLVSSAVELLGAIIAAVPETPYLREYTDAVKTANQIDNVIDRLADRNTEIDETVSGYHHVAAELVNQTGIEYPTTIRSTPVATKYWIDDRFTKSFTIGSVERKARRLEQRSAEWFQSLGLTVIGIGFAVQLAASVLGILL